jgi:hypothetical protein
MRKGHARTAILIAFNLLLGCSVMAADSQPEDPSSVLQAAPLHRSAPLNLTVLVASVLILSLAVIGWPISHVIRRHYRRALAHPIAGCRLRRYLRLAAIYALIWIAGWTYVLLPVLSLQLDFYHAGRDPLIRTLQIAGLVLIVSAVGAIYATWRLGRLAPSWPSRIGNALIGAALCGLIWTGLVGGLIGFDLNY